jgi:(p)ppGpp synthase/HD superfamily hydrolase
MGDWNKILAAARFAKAAHAGQKRFHGAPYFSHPRAVARLLKGRAPETLAAAYLHDVVEDTPVTRNDIEATFGGRVAALVDAVTKRAGEEREDFYRRVARAGPEAVAIKLADREHNNSELHLLDESFTTLRRKALEKTELMKKIFG